MGKTDIRWEKQYGERNDNKTPTTAVQMTLELEESNGSPNSQAWSSEQRQAVIVRNPAGMPVWCPRVFRGI